MGPPKRSRMAMARRVSLFEREVAVKLAPLALDLLHDVARVMTEGEIAGDVYAGSTMLTVDLARTAAMISDPPDASTAQRVAFLYVSRRRALAASARAPWRSARRAGAPAASSPHRTSISRAARAARKFVCHSTSRPGGFRDRAVFHSRRRPHPRAPGVAPALLDPDRLRRSDRAQGRSLLLHVLRLARGQGGQGPARREA